MRPARMDGKFQVIVSLAMSGHLYCRRQDLALFVLSNPIPNLVFEQSTENLVGRLYGNFAYSIICALAVEDEPQIRWQRILMQLVQARRIQRRCQPEGKTFI